jgi:acetate kinase
MNILVLNAGSASLKFEVIATSNDLLPSPECKLVSGIVEGIGERARFSLLQNKETILHQHIDAADYGAATHHIFDWLSHNPKQSKITADDLNAIAHRVVHGGDRFTDPVLIDADVMTAIEDLEELAPLHNAPALACIRSARKAVGKNMAMVAAFDTIFHRTIPEYAALYGLPWKLARRHKIRRYGFHGISHEYLARRYGQITNTPFEDVTVVTLHLESGCSACAVLNGQSIDTSMGFTPLEGLMMGMRCGDVDPSIVGYLSRKENVDVKKVEDWLNNDSGLLGVSGKSHDTRALMQLINEDERALLAMEIFCYRIRKYLGSYLAALGGAQAIIFGGGIGEDTPFVREQVLKDFEWLGLRVDVERNQQIINRQGRITTADSSVSAYVIPVEEGLMIARQTRQCLNQVRRHDDEASRLIR